MSSTVPGRSPVLTPWDSKSQGVPASESQPNVPKNFVWDLEDIGLPKEKLNAPVIDLKGFFQGDKLAIEHASELLKEACKEHGFFQVINHGVDPKLLNDAHNCLDDFFKLPIEKKLKALKKPGSMWGFMQAHADRFSTNLLWKETLSFPYTAKNPNASSMVVDYCTSELGSELEAMGNVYQNYCQALNDLALAIIELLGISLGVEREYYRDFFEDGSSIMRCNFYPTCEDPARVLGTGPHCDPSSLTILYQDQVGGLEVFADGKWQAVEPRPDALVINIGDTFMALSNGKYKSCLHRALVNASKERKSMAFFLNPKEDKVVSPPEFLCKPTRKYPDFTWSELKDFTQKNYRPDDHTLDSFTNWRFSSESQQ